MHRDCSHIRQRKWCTCVLCRASFTDCLLCCCSFVSSAAVPAKCGCHKPLGGTRFRVLHLISQTSPVSTGAKQQQQWRESQLPVEQSWLTWCLPEGPALSVSHRHSLRACKTMRNQSADRYTKLQSLWMTTVHERSRGSPRLGLSTNSSSNRQSALLQISIRASGILLL